MVDERSRLLKLLFETQDPELFADYLAIYGDGADTEVSPALPSRVTVLARRIVRRRRLLDFKKYKNQEKRDAHLARKHFAAIEAFRPTIVRFVRGRPWLTSILKWSVSALVALASALGLFRYLLGPRLVAIKTEVVTVSLPAHEIGDAHTKPIRDLFDSLWISKFATDKLAQIPSWCTADLAVGQPSVSCIDRVVPLLDGISTAESAELANVGTLQTELATWTLARPWNPSARRFFDLDFVTPAMQYGPDEARIRLGNARATEYACLVRHVSETARRLRVSLLALRGVEASSVVVVTIRNTRPDMSETYDLSQVRADDRPTSRLKLVRLDEAGRILGPAESSMAFPPQQDVSLVVRPSDWPGELTFRGAFVLSASFFPPFSQKEIRISVDERSRDVPKVVESSPGVPQGSSKWDDICGTRVAEP